MLAQLVEALRGLGIAQLHQRRPGQQNRRRDPFQVPLGDRGIRVPGEHDLALLGDLQPAIDRPRRLGGDRAVKRTPTPAQRTAPAVEHGEFDVIGVGPGHHRGL